MTPLAMKWLAMKWLAMKWLRWSLGLQLACGLGSAIAAWVLLRAGLREERIVLGLALATAIFALAHQWAKSPHSPPRGEKRTTPSDQRPASKGAGA